MTGWKTWVAAGGLVLFGTALIIQGEVEQGIQRIIEALAIVGIGHKIEKSGK